MPLGSTNRITDGPSPLGYYRELENFIPLAITEGFTDELKCYR
jgi:hypothetical protein